MSVFGGLYNRVLTWSRHRHAPRYLCALSFAESSFFPIPPDVMLGPMALAQPSRAFYFALITTLASVAGGILGYLIGHFAIDWAVPLMRDAGYYEKFEHAQSWFAQYGFLAVFAAGFSPIPYKIFTITAGALSMSMPLFVVASFVGRGARFFLLSGLIRAAGPGLQENLQRYIDRVALVTVVVLAVGIWLLKR